MKRAVVGAFVILVLLSQWSPLHSRSRVVRLAVSCPDDATIVQVFPEGHAWATRRSWLVLDNQGSEPATVYYRSAAFIQKSLLTTVAPYSRTDVPVADLVWEPRAFSLTVWSSTGAVVAALISWEPGFTAPFSSPMTPVCHGGQP